MTDLKEMQKIGLQILIEVDNLCKKHGIQYTLSAGTLLGAIRHKGFIPWDDDIDIAMTLDNYNKFTKIAVRELPDHLFVENYMTEKNCPYLYTKIVDKSTTFVDWLVKDYYTAKGLAIDIFPIYKIKKNHVKKRELITRYCQRAIESNYSIDQKKTLKWYILKVLTVFSKFRLQNRIFFNFINREHKREGTLTCADSYLKTTYIPYEIYTEYRTINFENHEFMSICKIDTYLRYTYGDYMKLPPVSERVSNHGCIYWNANKPYKEYLKENNIKH